MTAIVVFAWMMVSPVGGCRKETSDTEARQEEHLLSAAKANGHGAETRPGLFGPVAATYGCLGYNVNFVVPQPPSNAQPVTFKETLTTDSKGNIHYSRHWSVAGLTARATLPDRSPYMENGVPVTFVVLAGHEMFNIKNPNTMTGVPSAAASGEVFIHQGTIVLENVLTKENIVIRHVIIKTPSQGIIKDAWYVGGQACS